MGIPKKAARKYTEISFKIGLILKGLNAGLEVISGFLAFFVSQALLLKVANFLTADELSEDPKDTIANYILKEAHHFSIADKNFLILYLLSHGIIKLFLVIALWRKKLWAYPLSLIIFSLFIVYQVYRYSFTHSSYLIVLSTFDAIVLYLIWREYQFLKISGKN